MPQREFEPSRIHNLTSATMPPIRFNFSAKDSNEPIKTRPFPDRPSWDDLAHSVSNLYLNIPSRNISLSYTNNNGDEVDMRSEKDLQNFYQSMLEPGTPAVVKVKVHALNASALPGYNTLRKVRAMSCAHRGLAHHNPGPRRYPVCRYPV